MIKLNKTITKYNNILILILIISISLFVGSCNDPSQASDFPECFVGTYINQEGSGAQSIWNLYKDGNFAGQSSTEQLFNFSGQLGSWVRTGSREASIVMLDFSFNNEGAEANIARVDINVTFKGENCEDTEGSFELRFFQEGEDPLDVSTDDGEVIEDSFTGRKLIL